MGAAEAHTLVGNWPTIRRERGERWREEHPPIYGQPGYYQSPQWQQQRPEHHHHHHMRREEWERLHPGEDWFDRERRRREWERANPGVPFVGAEALVGAWYQMVGNPSIPGPHNPLNKGPYGDPHGARGWFSQGHIVGANPMVAAAEAYGISPRAVMVPAPTAEQAQRQTLPMNTGGAVVTTTVAALITSRPQRQAFRPERIFVSNASSPTSTLGAGGAADWLINDISIGNRSQYVQAGSLPGDIFQSTAIDSFVTFETAQTAMDVTMSVTYNGTGTTGEVNGLPFWGSIHGTAAV